MPGLQRQPTPGFPSGTRRERDPTPDDTRRPSLTALLRRIELGHPLEVWTLGPLTAARPCPGQLTPGSSLNSMIRRHQTPSTKTRRSFLCPTAPPRAG